MIRENIFTIAKETYTSFAQSVNENFNFDDIESQARLFLGLMDGSATDTGQYDEDPFPIVQHVTSFVACYITAKDIFESGVTYLRSKLAEENLHFTLVGNTKMMCSPPFKSDETGRCSVIIDPQGDNPYEALISNVEFDPTACQFIYRII